MAASESGGAGRALGGSGGTAWTRPRAGGRCGLLALLGGSCLWLCRGLLPSGRLGVGLTALALGLAAPVPLRPGPADEDEADAGWARPAAEDDPTLDLLRRLSAPIERLTG